MVAGALVVLTYLGIVPLLASDEVTLQVAYAFSGLAVLLAVLALMVFKPRVPERRPGQSVEEYWSTPEVSAKATRVWFLLEGAGMMAAVGYLMTAEPVPAVLTGLAIVAFWSYGPDTFAKA